MFDPYFERKQLGKIWIENDLGEDFETVKAERALTGYAQLGYLQHGICCHLIGFHDAAVKLLTKAHDWFQVAIAEKEIPNHYTVYATEASRLEDYAICNWLLTGSHDRESLDEFVGYEDLYLAEIGQSQEGLNLVLEVYLDAGAYSRVIELFESTQGLTGPKNIATIRRQGKMAYALALHRLGRAYTAVEIDRAVANFLAFSVPEWLEHGQYPTVARWMKLTRWNGEKTPAAAIDALLHCYDYLPGRERPSPGQPE